MDSSLDYKRLSEYSSTPSLVTHNSNDTPSRTISAIIIEPKPEKKSCRKRFAVPLSIIGALLVLAVKLYFLNNIGKDPLADFKIKVDDSEYRKSMYDASRALANFEAINKQYDEIERALSKTKQNTEWFKNFKSPIQVIDSAAYYKNQEMERKKFWENLQNKDEKYQQVKEVVELIMQRIKPTTATNYKTPPL